MRRCLCEHVNDAFLFIAYYFINSKFEYPIESTAHIDVVNVDDGIMTLNARKCETFNEIVGRTFVENDMCACVNIVPQPLKIVSLESEILILIERTIVSTICNII